jgi:hypothetical protein
MTDAISSEEEQFNRDVKELVFKLDRDLDGYDIGVLRLALTLLLIRVIVSYESQDPDVIAQRAANEIKQAVANRVEHVDFGVSDEQPRPG